jgi:hypothetical protein
MKSTFLFLLGACLLVSSLARGQGSLDKTTFGKSNNDERDLANSLVAAPQRYGKGEKKQQVSATDLKSKSIKDSTFGGSLLNIGIQSAEPKLDEAKLRTAPSEVASSASKDQPATTEKESNASKQTATTVEKDSSASTRPAENQAVFSSLSTTATLAENLGEAGAPAASASQSKTSSSSTATAAATTGDAPKKDQGSATTSTDKSSTTKPDGDH